MLESMRRHTQGWIAKVILGIIILSFAFWGIGNYFTGSQVEAVAEVDGEAIYDVEFAATYQRQLANYANMLGEQFTKELAERLGVKNETIQTMINRKLMLMEAHHMGLVTPDQAVAATVQSTPQFIEKGKGFSPARYQALIRQMGFATPRDYENYLRQNIMIDTLQNAITSSATVSDDEVKAKFESSYEKRVLAALLVSPDSLKPTIEVSDDEARDWYESHASMYQSPLKVEVKVVDMDKANLMKDVSVSDEAIAQAYEERQAEYTTPEKRRASHILVRVAPDASAEIKKAAKDKIVAAKARLDAGESFADVAKDVSDDVTAASGGDLGYFTRGSMVPAFDREVFEGLKVGDISDIVKTKYGYHLIQLNDIQNADVKPLAEVRDDIYEQLLHEQAAEEAYQLSQDLDNALGMEDSLEAAAKSVNLPVRDLGAVSQDNVLADPLLGKFKELQQKVFGMQPGDAIEIIEVDDGHYVALEVVNRIEPATMAYEDVVKRVFEDVRNDKAVQAAQEIANKALAAAKAGKNIDDLVQQFGQGKFISKPVRSNGEGDDAPWVGAVLEPAFRTPDKHWVDTVMATPDGFAVVFVQEVQPADESLFAEQKDTIRREVLKAKGAVRFATWMASVRDRHDIDVNERVLNRF